MNAEKRAIYIRAIVDTNRELDENDRDAAGLYCVDLDASLDDGKAASVALDVFHTHQGIEVLDDFRFEVIDAEGNTLTEDPEHETNSMGDEARVTRVSLDPFDTPDQNEHGPTP